MVRRCVGMSYSSDLVKVRRLIESGMARAIREAAGQSLTELAKTTEVDRSTVWRWEHGQRRARGEAAIRYLRVLEELGELMPLMVGLLSFFVGLIPAMADLRTVNDLAEILRTTPTAVRRLRERGSLPPAFKIGARLLWD